MSKQKLVTFTNVSYSIHEHNILEDVSFDLYAGETTSLIGLNGAGKSTVLKMITGGISPTSGNVQVFTSCVGYVPQHFSVDRTIPVRVGELLHAYSGRKKQDILDKLKEVHAVHLFDKKFGVLSGGERQRVLLANALLQQPQLLLLDEPTAGVDVQGEKSFYELVQYVQKEYNMCIMLVSHDLHHVYAYSDQVLCLQKKLLCHGTPKEIEQCTAFHTLFHTEVGHYHHSCHDDAC